MFALIAPDHRYGRNFGMLSCIQMLRSYFLWSAEKKDDAFLALDAALDYARQLDALHKCTEKYFSSPLLHNVPIHAEESPAGSAFCAELPDLWPWWDVSEQEKVKAEMQTDPRWAEWVGKTRE